MMKKHIKFHTKKTFTKKCVNFSEKTRNLAFLRYWKSPKSDIFSDFQGFPLII